MKKGDTLTHDKDVAILFSGGTDSTAAAALLANDFNKVHLVTYNRFGFHSTENTKNMYDELCKKFGDHKFSYHLINIDKLFKQVSYHNYLKNLKKHGFMLLSTCGLCKLSMHIRTIQFCLDNNVTFVADGANQAMTLFPAQMKEVIEQLHGLYQEYGIHYFNPVFFYNAPKSHNVMEKIALSMSEDMKKSVSESQDKSKVEFQNELQNKLKDESEIQKKKCELSSESFINKELTPGEVIYNMGLAPSKDIKGTELDKKRQPRCFQFLLFNIFAHNIMDVNENYDQYKSKTVSFFKDKMIEMNELIKKGKLEL